LHWAMNTIPKLRIRNCGATAISFETWPAFQLAGSRKDCNPNYLSSSNVSGTPGLGLSYTTRGGPQMLRDKLRLVVTLYGGCVFVWFYTSGKTIYF